MRAPNILPASTLPPAPSARFQVQPASPETNYFGNNGQAWSTNSNDLASRSIDDANRRGAYFKKTAESLRLGSERH